MQTLSLSSNVVWKSVIYNLKIKQNRLSIKLYSPTDSVEVVIWIQMERQHVIALTDILDDGANSVRRGIQEILYSREILAKKVSTVIIFMILSTYTIQYQLSGKCDATGSISPFPDENTGRCICKVGHALFLLFLE